MSSTSSTVRTFVALPLSREVAQALSEVQRCLREYLREEGEVRWVHPSRFHVTLAFIGDLPRFEIPALTEGIAAKTRGIAPFSFTLAHLGAFPSLARPQVLWIGVEEGVEPLSRLAEAVRAGVRDAVGWRGGEERFIPHVTLGRTKRRWGRLGEGAAACVPAPVGPQRAGRVVVYASRLTPQGAIYHELSHVDLEASQ